MKKFLLLIALFNSYAVLSQTGSGKDSTAFLDSIMREMDAILDEMMPSKSYVSAGIGAGTGFFNFKNSSSTASGPKKKLLLSPSASYLHKSGFGLSATGFILPDSSKLNFYQFSLSPSYDYIRRGQWAAGITYTRYFTKDDLSFYTTPIQNEVYAYFNYKKIWLQPGIAAGYGWGSRSALESRRVHLLRARQTRNPRLVTIRNDESVNDLSLLFSVRHSFHLEDIFGGNDLFTITPVLLLSSGTQKYGFNTSYQSKAKSVNNFLPNNQYISENSGMQFQSASFVLRADYSTGIFFVQGQGLLDYYLHSVDNRLNNAFAIIAGVNF